MILIAPILMSQSSPAALENSIVLYKQQQQEKAFQIFIEALALVPLTQVTPKISAEEDEVYQQALKLYLTTKNERLCSGSQELLSRYAPILEAHPEYEQLAFIVAAAYANLGDYAHFFDLFYRAYLQYPNHYLAHKTQAILSIKLFERALPGQEKERWRSKILFHLDQAQQLYPMDISIYRLMILYAPAEQRPTYVADSLKKIIAGDIVIPRLDLEFYVQQALSLNDIELIQSFLDKASEWYHYSRILNAARQQLLKR
jgi:hypothetical protein